VDSRTVKLFIVAFISVRELNVGKINFDFMISELTQECKIMYIELASFVLLLLYSDLN